ncbi:MAG: hypothetical protein ACLTPN_01110 [Clostridia bacterium]
MFYRIMDFIKNIPREIKWFFQRGTRGYSDKDVWSIDIWFKSIIIPMLEQLKETKQGHPIDMTEEEWNLTLNNMINYFKECTDFYCSEKNEYEDEYMSRIMSANEYDKLLADKWLKREEEIDKYKNEMKDKAFELFSKHFYSLWD